MTTSERVRGLGKVIIETHDGGLSGKTAKIAGVRITCVFRRCRSPVPTSRSPIPEHADHPGGAEVHSGAGGSGYGVEV